MRSLLFDPGKMYIFVFSIDYKLISKENLENFISDKCIYGPNIFCENFINVHPNFFQ